MPRIVRTTDNLGLRILSSMTPDAVYNLDQIDRMSTQTNTTSNSPHVTLESTTNIFIEPESEGSGGIVTIRNGHTGGNITLLDIYADAVRISSGTLNITSLATGVVHSVDGELQSSLVINADVHASAAIDESKLALDYGTSELYSSITSHIANSTVHPNATTGEYGQVLSTDGENWFWTDVDTDAVDSQFSAYLETIEAMEAGDFVNIIEDGGDTKIQLASKTDTTKGADGFVKSGGEAGDSLLVYFMGINDQLSTLDIGSFYFLDAAGKMTTDTAGEGELHQLLGTALSSTEIYFIKSPPIIRV